MPLKKADRVITNGNRRYMYKRFIEEGEYDNAFTVLSHVYRDEPNETYPTVCAFREILKQSVYASVRGGLNGEENYGLLKKTYLLTARNVFDDFCIYTEWERPYEQKFYLPRREYLLPLANALQRLADDETDLLAISLPPGVGKSGLAIFFTVWLAGRNPHEGMLFGSHSASIMEDMYAEVLRELDPNGDYLWFDVFPERRIVRTNAKNLKIDIDQASRFSTFQFTSVGSSNAGRLRAIQLLYCDDLVPGIEVALNREQMDKIWRLYTDDLLQRKGSNHCKELHIATRWSVHDPIGRLKEINEGNPRAEFIEVPALNENGESNFAFGDNQGFSTETFRKIKEKMDDMTWRALYMNEPIEREGQLYNPNDLRRYFDLPDREPDAVMAVCDTADGNGDYTVMPIFAVYGDDHYMIDCVCSDALPEVTDRLCAEALVRNCVQQCQFECNGAGGRTADKVEELVKAKCAANNTRPTHITKKRTLSQKATKIIVNSTVVKEKFLFRDPTKIVPGTPYALFMSFMTAYTVKGKNKHDDVPDALAQYALYVDKTNFGGLVRIMNRPF